MRHLRPLNDNWQLESQFEIIRDFKNEVEIHGAKYFMPITSEEVRYQIEDVLWVADEHALDVVFKDNGWKGPVYVMLYKVGQRSPLRVVSVMPDNYYLEVYVDVPEDVDMTDGQYFVVMTNVVVADDAECAAEWESMGMSRVMKQLKTE